jgi:hypothetical protein
MDALEPYYRRFRKRFFRDATPWARDNIVWGIIVLVVPPFAAYLRAPHAPMDWILIKNSLLLYGFALAIYVLAYLRGTAKHLDDDRDTRERTLVGTIAEREQSIKERQEMIRVLQEKPKRSPPDQYHYDRAKTFLDKQGAQRPKFISALQHLYTHGDLTYSVMGVTMNTTWPKGMDRNEAIPIYTACMAEGLVSTQEITGLHPARKLFIAPAMTSVLSEFLY